MRVIWALLAVVPVQGRGQGGAAAPAAPPAPAAPAAPAVPAPPPVAPAPQPVALPGSIERAAKALDDAREAEKRSGAEKLAARAAVRAAIERAWPEAAANRADRSEVFRTLDAKTAKEFVTSLELRGVEVTRAGAKQALTDAVRQELRDYVGATEAEEARKAEAAVAATAARPFEIGPGRSNYVVLVGPEAVLSANPEKFIAECLAGTPIDEIGVRARVAARGRSGAGAEAGPGDGEGAEDAKEEVRDQAEAAERAAEAARRAAETARKAAEAARISNITRLEGHAAARMVGETARKIRVGPEDAIFVMPVEYTGEWDPGQKRVVRRCQHPVPFRKASTTSIEAFTFGPIRDGTLRTDLMPEDLRSEVNEKLRYQHHVLLPVRKLMYLQGPSSAEDTLLDDQEIVLRVTRGMTKVENDRLGTATSELETIRPTWHLPVKDMPRLSLRLPLLLGVVQRVTHATEEGKQQRILTAGTALALSARFVAQGQYYLRVDLLLPHFAVRAGDASEIPATLVGVGAQVDISGYVALGASYMKDVSWGRKPVLLFTLSPLPWVLKALGLERTSVFQK